MNQPTYAIGLLLFGILIAMIYEWIVLPILDGTLAKNWTSFVLWLHYKKTGINVTKQIKELIKKAK